MRALLDPMGYPGAVAASVLTWVAGVLHGLINKILYLGSSLSNKSGFAAAPRGGCKLGQKLNPKFPPQLRRTPTNFARLQSSDNCHMTTTTHLMSETTECEVWFWLTSTGTQAQ